MPLFDKPPQCGVRVFPSHLRGTDDVWTAARPDRLFPRPRRCPRRRRAFAAVQNGHEEESLAEESAQPYQGPIDCSNGDDHECIGPKLEFSNSSMSPST